MGQPGFDHVAFLTSTLTMRPLTLLLIVLLVLIQYPLWLGKGGWLRVWDLGRQIEQQTKTNEELKTRNASLAGEVKDLKEGADAVEERARYELGMIKDGEVFVQIVDTPPKPPVSAPPQSSPPPGMRPGTQPGTVPTRTQ